MVSPQSDKKILVSACLAGVNCTFRGTNNLNRNIKKLVDNGRAIAICPEIFGRLGIPRENIEISGGDGNRLIEGKARAITSSGKDVTQNLINGANSALKLVDKLGIREAVLKSHSPTCGSGTIYDGTFTKTLVAGDGVLSALLKKNGIKVVSEKEV